MLERVNTGISTNSQQGPKFSRTAFVLEVIFNKLITHVPVRRFRTSWLRIAGASLAPDVSIFCGIQVLHPPGLSIGRRGAVGWRTFLDARGGLEIGDEVNVASDCHIITADHDVRSPRFEARYAPVRLGDYTSIGTRCVVLKGVTFERGAAAAAGAVVSRDVPESVIVAGVPAREIARRPPNLDYRIGPPPFFA